MEDSASASPKPASEVPARVKYTNCGYIYIYIYICVCVCVCVCVYAIPSFTKNARQDKDSVKG